MLDQSVFTETIHEVAEIIRTSATPLSKEEILSYFKEMELNEQQENMVLEFLLTPHEEEEAEAHEHEQEHEHEGNSHIWLSPARAAQQAESIAAALSEMDQADAAVFGKCGEVQGGNGCAFAGGGAAEFAGRHGSRGIP